MGVCSKCNCSGKSLTADGTAKLRNQIIDAPWVTPGQFTQAPSLDCIFSQCYSIKSWLDLRNDHVAIVHCSNGRSRSGILIACLLKYIGAFTHASQAFDFFCSARWPLYPIVALYLYLYLYLYLSPWFFEPVLLRLKVTVPLKSAPNKSLLPNLL